MQTYDWDDGGGDGNVVDVFMAVMEQYPPKWPLASPPLFSIRAEFKAAAGSFNGGFDQPNTICSSVRLQKGRIKISIVARHLPQVLLTLHYGLSSM